MTNLIADSNVFSSIRENESLKNSLFELLTDSDSKQINGGYWSHHPHQETRERVTSHRHSINRAAITFNSDAIAPHVPLVRSDFSHHTAANRLDDLLLT